MKLELDPLDNWRSTHHDVAEHFALSADWVKHRPRQYHARKIGCSWRYNIALILREGEKLAQAMSARVVVTQRQGAR
jgi:hypothetical protein